jgi:poly [ADP-ribose] polymerase
VKKPGKYFPQDIEEDDNDPSADSSKKTEGGDGDGDGDVGDNAHAANRFDDADVIPSYLDPRVQDVVRLIFDTELLTQTMRDLDLDVRKMPLGKISKQQVTKGYELLRQIEQVLQHNDTNKAFQLLQLTNQFYATIPHAYKTNQKPELIDNHATLKRKMQQLEILLDLQIAATLLKHDQTELTRTHPLDRHYQVRYTTEFSLACALVVS